MVDVGSPLGDGAVVAEAEGDAVAWLLEHKQLLDPVYRKHLERVGFGSD